MFTNRLPASKVADLEPGAHVVIESFFGGTWGDGQVHTGTVKRITPAQIVVHYTAGDRTVETRYRRKDGRQIGGRGELLDPEHERTTAALAGHRRKRLQQAIDALAARWTRERDNLDLLRRLQAAVSEYLDAEA